MTNADIYRIHDYTANTILYEGPSKIAAETILEDMYNIHTLGIEYVYNIKSKEATQNANSK